MTKRLFMSTLALACVLIAAGCSMTSDPQSGDTRTKQERERPAEPDGMKGGGGGSGGGGGGM